jgi:hypothetical protein
MKTFALLLGMWTVGVACTEAPADEGVAELPQPDSRSETYEQICEADSDCVIVAYASCASCGSCGDVAISAAEVDRFDADNELSGCPPRQPASCGACPDLIATCDEESCVLLNCSLGECP